MNGKITPLAGPVSLVALAMAGLFVLNPTAAAQDVQHLTITQPGGMPGLPVMTGIEKTTNGVTVTWDGPSGYYQLLKKLGLLGGTWQPAGGASLSRKATITGISSNEFFRVSGPAPHYVGSQACIECHEDIHTEEMDTSHAGALETLKRVEQDKNPSCLPCHTVGYGLPTGYVSEASTPHLAGVQCENCHGPAGNHAADEFDLTVRPRVELASQVCGGCHNTENIPASAAAYHRPYYEEWNTSAHREVLPELQADFASANGPTVFIPTCGRCHSGTVREAFLENDPLPDAHEASAVGIACATCHDPHSKYVHTNVLNGVFTNVVDGRSFVITNSQLGVLYTNQLSNPLASLQDYHTAGNFVTNYNPDINVCGQCHNDRGASSITTDRAPHHSPQYNVLLGNFRELDTGAPPNQLATHSLLEKQCVSCHMQTSDYVSAAQPATAGHTFEVDDFETCARCHQDAANAQNLVVFWTGNISNQIQVIKEFYLDAWAVNYAPDSLKTKYGTRAWEYTTPGDFYPGTSGPTAAEQALIPDNIKKARFDLYLVLYDGSYGVHNPGYSLNLLMNAANFVQLEINQ